jgi:hypothetical protein
MSADVVVVACGAANSARLLLMSVEGLGVGTESGRRELSPH